jgi:hypothetical protein
MTFEEAVMLDAIVETQDELVLDDDLDSEPVPEPIDTQRRRIFTQAADPNVQGLHEDFRGGYLVLQPDFQRYFVWDKTKSNRLIESVLLNVPLPVVYFAQEADGTSSVIDGQQRLTSFFEYIDGNFELQNLKVMMELNGKRFKDLTKLQQRAIQQCSIRAITILSESDAELRFEIFERLNTGSVALNDQELRNCVYRGAYNGLLRKLAQDPDFMYLLGLSEPEKRMRDVELVLRFAAFYHWTYLKYQPPMRRFLNREMQKYQDITIEEAQELQRAFKNSVQIIRSLLDRNAFKRFYRGTETKPNGIWEPKKFNSSLYDILMWGFTRYEKPQVFLHLDAIREALINLMSDNSDFIEAIELSTSSAKNVNRRFDIWRRELESVMGSPTNEPRIFSSKLKHELFDQDSSCAICGNQILHIDDAAVDHVKQYWTGGRTIKENARLTHRYCNWSRPRGDVVDDASRQ